MSFRFAVGQDSIGRMKRLAVALAFTMLGGLPALSQTVDERTLAFGCDDLVVVGRLENGDWHPVDDASDILGHGWVDATLSVRRIVKGRVSGRSVPVRYLGHAYLRDERDFMFVLSRQPDGSLVIDSGQLMSAHPKLAERCG